MPDERATVVDLHARADDLAMIRDAFVELRGRGNLVEQMCRAFGARAYRWVTLVMLAALAAFVAYEPTLARIVVLVLFPILAHLPVWWRKEPQS